MSEILSSITKGEKDLGISMTGKWARQARETWVKKQPDFLQPKSHNADQVSDATKSHLFYIWFNASKESIEGLDWDTYIFVVCVGVPLTKITAC